MKRSAALALVLVFAAALLAAQTIRASRQQMLLGDFQAFYCGGAAVLHGTDPYAAKPLLACERKPQPFGLHSARDSVDLPAPFPGYALAVYASFALLPYPPAALLWFLLSLGCAAFAAAALACLCRMSLPAVLALIATGFCVAVFPYGENAALIIALLAAAALALRAGRTVRAAACVTAAAILPHVALPALVALFVWRRDLRVPLALGALILALADSAASGPAGAVAYLVRVLPAHDASEIGFITQYSATWAAHALGAGDRLALAAGSLSYAVLAGGGVVLGGLLARRFRDPAFLVLVPPACSVLGGPFIHYSEILIALPAAILLYRSASGIPRIAAAAAALLVALPWQAVVVQPDLIAAVTVGAGLIAWLTFDRTPIASLRLSLAAATVCVAVVLAAAHFGPQTSVRATGALDWSLADASWAFHVGAEASSSGAVWWIAKAPTWIGLALLALCAGAAVSKKDLELRVAIKDAPAGA